MKRWLTGGAVVESFVCSCAAPILSPSQQQLLIPWTSLSTTNHFRFPASLMSEENYTSTERLKAKAFRPVPGSVQRAVKGNTNTF